MTKKDMFKPVAIAVSAALAGGISVANADTSPFVMTTLSSGYMSADIGEGKCGGDKAEAEGKCGEGKAGAEGKCGEGKCGGDKAEGEGKCGGDRGE